MTLEALLVQVLKQFSPRTYGDFASPTTPRPYITFQQIGGDVIVPLGREVPNKENVVVQINVWADSRSEAKAMIKAIDAALVLTTDFQAKPVSAPQSDFDADIPVYCSRQDFSIWHDR
jgi:hypothetical protein